MPSESLRASQNGTNFSSVSSSSEVLWVQRYCLVVKVDCLIIVSFRLLVGVAVSLMAHSEMLASGMRGKGFKVLHVLGDQLWYVLIRAGLLVFCVICYSNLLTKAKKSIIVGQYFNLCL